MFTASSWLLNFIYYFKGENYMLNKKIYSLLPALSKNLLGFSVFSIVLAFSFNAFAQEEAASAVSGEVAYILNTFLFLVCGFLVMFMAAGFCMLEAGQVRSKNTAVICLKNIGLFSIAGLMYYLIGYNLMYDGVDGGYLGSFSLLIEVLMSTLKQAMLQLQIGFSKWCLLQRQPQ